MPLLLTWKLERSPPEPTLSHTLAMEKPIVDFANEFLQLLASGVDEQGSCLAEYCPLNPQLCADGCRGPQRTSEAQHPGYAKDNFLLLGWHGGVQSPLRDAAFSEAATRSSSARQTAKLPRQSPGHPASPACGGSPLLRELQQWTSEAHVSWKML